MYLTTQKLSDRHHWNNQLKVELNTSSKTILCKDAILKNVLYALDLRFLYGTVPQYIQYGCRNQGVEAEVPPTTLSLMNLRVLCAPYLDSSEVCIVRVLGA